MQIIDRLKDVLLLRLAHILHGVTGFEMLEHLGPHLLDGPPEDLLPLLEASAVLHFCELILQLF